MNEEKFDEFIAQLNLVVDTLRKIQDEENLNNDQFSEITRLESDLLRLIQDLSVEAMILSIEEINSVVGSLKALTESIENTIDKVKKIDKGIKVATSAVKLASAIATGNFADAGSEVVNIVGLLDAED